MIRSDQEAAQELVNAVKLLAKKEVPEAFKKEWKNKDKDGDGKENEPKPDFLKKKEKKSSLGLTAASPEKELLSRLDRDVAKELVKIAKKLMGENEDSRPRTAATRT